jgi:probable HAF family extracellular repeat protein
MVALPTSAPFGGIDSEAFAVNDRGDIVGVAANAVADQYSSGLGPCTTVNCWPVTTQLRAVLWRNGRMQDLGTLGSGNDAVAVFVNRFGQIAGVSYTNTTPNPTTELPTQDPFLWQSGQMTDLGTLGGTWGVVEWLNDLGQVTGISNLAGDQTHHAYLWSRGVLTDLGTLGGANSDGFDVNNAGEVIGISDTSNGDTHGFLWRDGRMTDIPPLPGDDLSNADVLNDEGIIVGESCTNGCQGRYRAMLWVNGAEVDLNALVTPLPICICSSPAPSLTAVWSMRWECCRTAITASPC